jgi:phage-related protein (TIGR01555 family)
MAKNKNKKRLENGVFQDTVQSVIQQGTQVNQLGTAQNAYRTDLITNDRWSLTNLYSQHGVLQTLVDVPVLDAFRAGYTLKSEQASPEEIEKVINKFENEGYKSELIKACQWKRLYGGAGLIINTGDTSKPFNIDRINDKTKLEIISADRWELFNSEASLNSVDRLYDQAEKLEGNYMYYGHIVHRSRVLEVKGKEAPALLRSRLMGFGLSEFEKVISSFNMYQKEINVLFQMMDKSKRDIVKISGFRDTFLNKGSEATAEYMRTQYALSNFMDCIVMDAEDLFEMHQINFAGFADMWKQLKENLAADFRFPLTKLFGVSSAGFNSGEDDIENYNAMVESEVRTFIKPVAVDLFNITFQQLFQYIPDDLVFEFNPLRIMSSEQEEIIKAQKFARITQSLEMRLITDKQAVDAINAGNLLEIKI